VTSIVFYYPSEYELVPKLGTVLMICCFLSVAIIS